MEYTADIKYVRISPKKLRFIIDDIKHFRPKEVLDKLLYDRKRSSKILYKAIKSAIDNAISVSKVKAEDLRFKVLKVDQGPSHKRHRAGGRGVVKSYKRKTSHIKVVLITEVKER